MATPQQQIFHVESLDDLTHDIKRVRLRGAGGARLHFRAGQYASVTFPGQQPRDYSLASLPGETVLEFHIRRMVQGSASHFVSDRLEPGDPVTVAGPLGDGYLRETHAGPILGIAGSSGLAPIGCIVEAALTRGARQPVSLYFGARTEKDIYMEDRFTALAARHANFTYVPVLSETEGPTARRQGYVHAAVSADFTDLTGHAAYLAGPPAMVEAALPALLAGGMLAGDIHADAFYDDHVMRRLEAERAASAGGAPKERGQ